MKLDEYLKKNNMSEYGLADKLGCHAQTIKNYLNGKVPSSQMAQKIILFTNGEVTLEELIEGVRKPRCKHCGQTIRTKSKKEYKEKHQPEK